MKNVHSVQHSSKIWNQVKFDHLQRHCDEPIDVPVKDWGAVERDPELTHVKVMHCGDQSNQCTDVQGCLPVEGHRLTLHQKEARGRHIKVDMEVFRHG